MRIILTQESFHTSFKCTFVTLQRSEFHMSNHIHSLFFLKMHIFHMWTQLWKYLRKCSFMVCFTLANCCPQNSSWSILFPSKRIFHLWKSQTVELKVAGGEKLASKISPLLFKNKFRKENEISKNKTSSHDCFNASWDLQKHTDGVQQSCQLLEGKLLLQQARGTYCWKAETRKSRRINFPTINK